MIFPPTAKQPLASAATSERGVYAASGCDLSGPFACIRTHHSVRTLKRRKRRAPMLLVFGILQFALLLLPALGAQKSDTKQLKPNFILILADDMGYGDIGSFGSTKNRTPNLDRMAQEGMKLTSFYAAPVCTPSRAQIITGCYAKRVSLPNVLGPRTNIGISADEDTIASLLKSLGYATYIVGKWHLGDAPVFLPTRHGFDNYLGLPYSNDMGGEHAGKETIKNGHRVPPLPLVKDEEVIETLKPEDQDKLTALYTENAIKFVRA